MPTMHDLTGTCKQVTHLISEGMDRDLSFGERIRIRFHLMMCKGCANFDKQMGTLRAASRAFAEHFFPDGRG